MGDEVVTSIVESQDLEMLSLLHFFAKTRAGGEIRPLYLGGSVHKKYHQVKPLIKLDLLEAEPPSHSYVFYRDRLEDFVFQKCEQLILECIQKATEREAKIIQMFRAVKEMGLPEELCESPGEQERLRVRQAMVEDFLRESKTRTPVITRFKNRADVLNELKVAFAYLLSVVKNVAHNERTKDPESQVRSKFVRVLGTYDLEKEVPKNRADLEQGKKLLGELERLGFWKEYSPAQRYYLTGLGAAVVQKLVDLKISEKTREEEEFERLVQELGLG